MAPAERPPSEQGVEYRTLDAIAELTRKVDELAQRPAIALPAHANWWDVLGRPDERWRWADIFAPGIQPWYLPNRRPEIAPVLQVAAMADRLELSLRVQGGTWTVWQRALFFDDPGPLAVARGTHQL